MKQSSDKVAVSSVSGVGQDKVSELELYYLTLAYEQGIISFKDWRKQSKEWALSVLSKQRLRSVVMI